MTYVTMNRDVWLPTDLLHKSMSQGGHVFVIVIVRGEFGW